MGIKELLKGTIEGTGEVAESLISAVTGIVKEGTEDISGVFGAVIDLGKDGVVDVASGVRDAYIGAINALKESGKTTEDAISEVTTNAERAISNISEESMETVGGAAKKGIEEAKEILKTPLAK
jgi:phage-related protein